MSRQGFEPRTLGLKVRPMPSLPVSACPSRCRFVSELRPDRHGPCCPVTLSVGNFGRQKCRQKTTTPYRSRWAFRATRTDQLQISCEAASSAQAANELKRTLVLFATTPIGREVAELGPDPNLGNVIIDLPLLEVVDLLEDAVSVWVSQVRRVVVVDSRPRPGL